MPAWPEIALDFAPLAPALFGALVLGAFGSLHCLGMCGGIAGALGQAAAGTSGPSGLQRLVLYSAGRISSYALAGVAAGFAGEVVADGVGLTIGLRTLTGLFIVACGLHVLGLWNGLSILERLGLRVWRGLAPAARRLGRPDRSWKLLVMGMLWGWLPCGLVYTALLGAASTGGALAGGAFMAAFGIGTLPALLAAAGFAAQLADAFALRAARRAAGSMLLVFGLVSLSGALMPLLHAPAAADTPETQAPRCHRD